MHYLTHLKGAFTNEVRRFWTLRKVRSVFIIFRTSTDQHFEKCCPNDGRITRRPSVRSRLLDHASGLLKLFARLPEFDHAFAMISKPALLLLLLLTWSLAASEAVLPKATIDGTGLGWRALGEADFTVVNCPTNTFTWHTNGVNCTGQPVGVIRSKQSYTNLELVAEWRHLRSGGNSGIFLWARESSIRNLEAGKGRLPDGIEVQILDHGYTAQYERDSKKKADWFTSHGDVFPTGPAKMTPFPPVAPNSMRSFPRKNLSRGVGEWNHYYVRAINGEVRLWVNGEEVSGGTGCSPAHGFLCLESEGSPVEFRNLRIRELP